MTRKYTCKLSLRTKRRNTRRHHGGRGGAGGVAGAGHYGSATTTGAAQVLAQWNGRTPGLSSGGKRGIPLLTSFHRKKTRKNRRH